MQTPSTFIVPAKIQKSIILVHEKILWHKNCLINTAGGQKKPLTDPYCTVIVR